MDDFSPSDLKTILHSKRANMYYLQHCRILVNGGRVEYVTEEGNKSLYWNIPIANTTSILLGTGTSVTQAAMRELAKAGVLVGFCGGGGTPLFSANEFEIEISWMTPQSEYRPTEYLQKWVKFWFDDQKRLAAAKHFQSIRLKQIEKHWISSYILKENHFYIDSDVLLKELNLRQNQIQLSQTTNDVLSQEAILTKFLYKSASQMTKYGEFTRAKNGSGVDLANQFLDHGNYLAYGLAATAAWVLGLPHSLSILHGKTRRGGLVFDIADLVKDSIVLPQAFISAALGDDEQSFRKSCLENFNRTEAMDIMIDSIKSTIDLMEESVP